MGEGRSAGSSLQRWVRLPAGQVDGLRSGDKKSIDRFWVSGYIMEFHGHLKYLGQS